MILAFDIATVTGWAAGDHLASRPVSGLISLKDGYGIGGKMDLLTRAIELKITEFDPDLIIFEQPWFSAGRGSAATMRLAIALCATVELVAKWHDIRVLEVPISTWRKHFIGVGRAPKGESGKWCKEQARQRCRSLGWGDFTDDQAEACGIWDYAQSLRKSRNDTNLSA